MGTYIQLPETIPLELGLGRIQQNILGDLDSTTFISLSTTRIPCRGISFRYHEIDSETLNALIDSYASSGKFVVILCEASYHLKHYRLNHEAYVIGPSSVTMEDLTETAKFLNHAKSMNPLDVLIYLSRHGLIMRSSTDRGPRASEEGNVLVKLLIHGPERSNLLEYQDSLGCAYLSWADFQRLFDQHQLKEINV